jgi:hypothetical protein
MIQGGGISMYAQAFIEKFDHLFDAESSLLARNSVRLFFCLHLASLTHRTLAQKSVQNCTDLMCIKEVT